MLINEAKWISKELNKLSKKELFPILDIGSWDLYSRTVVQPWIDKYVFKPLRDRNIKVYHLDALNKDGVDIVMDVEEVERISLDFEPKAIIVTNLFEHLQNKKEVAEKIKKVIRKGGIIICSAPCDYPYHPGPIDNGFRPTTEQLAELFGSEVEVVAEKKVRDYTYWYYLKRNKFIAFLSLLRLLVPFYRPSNWWSHVLHIPWLNKRFAASCVILKKV